jgi:hypothetical protein
MRGKYLLYGTLAGGLTLFVWQVVSNVAIPWHEATLKPFTNNGAVVDAVRANTTGNGVYIAPQGITAAVSFTPDMADKMTATMAPNMIKTLVVDLVAALLLCVLVARIGVGRKRDTALTLGLGALAVGIVKELGNWIWYGFSASFAIANIVDLAIVFALAGIVIAWVYKREMQGAPVATVR